MPKMTIARVLLFAFILSADVYAVSAQTSSQQAVPNVTKTFVFEVASVRPAKERRGSGISATPDGARATGSPLKWIIRSAYNDNRDAVWFGEPEWTDTAFYDIEAKFDPSVYKDLTDDQRHAMIQALLADRFKLAVHRETRILPFYTLVVAEGGPKLRESDASRYVVDALNRPYCNAGLTNFRQCTMAEFAKIAPSIFHLDRIVEDRTGLSGRYDFELRYTTPGPGMDNSPNAVPIFDALPAQIGLKLEPTKGPVSVYVVDHVERPSEN
jgi:uncharacterized protein (TIGR03435 family)